MADKAMYPIGSFKYANRMMKAGDDPVLMNARDQRLYLALGKVSATKPKVADLREGPALRGGRVDTGTLEERPAPPAPSKAAPKRKAAPRKKRATAKK